MSINDYKLGKLIGSGTFGEVYQGRDIKTGMRVAVKRIRKKILYEKGEYLLKAYKREIDCMTKCACENSIKFIKEFATQNNYNIIMELCDTDLLCYLYERSNPFSIEEIKDTFLQLNNAFRKMSYHKILHRDLKLGNILITFTDETKKKFIPKLSDYGFSKELNYANYANCTHLGTPATMAPEIMLDLPYNEKSDLWSVGVMMYQLYFKEVPYEGNTEAEILSKIKLNIPLKQPEDMNFRDLLNRLLTVDSDKRLSWEEYFDHPFFTGNDLDICCKKNGFNSYNSFSYSENFNRFDDFHNPNLTPTPYSYNNLDTEYCFQGDIYSNSSKELTNLKGDQIELLNKGKRIDDYEYNVIIKECKEVKDQNKNLYPISKICTERIKQKLPGEWFVLVCPEEEKNYDFYISFNLNEKYMNFVYKNNLFQVCQLK